jgi:hypothetical protein
VEHAAQVLQENPGLHVVVEGYTDSVGSDSCNQRLSERRADSVRDYLVEKGISPSRIRTRGYGETRPVASNATEEGRAQNRRVEIITERRRRRGSRKMNSRVGECGGSTQFSTFGGGGVTSSAPLSVRTVSCCVWWWWWWWWW